jgi:TolA-binding protein
MMSLKRPVGGVWGAVLCAAVAAALHALGAAAAEPAAAFNSAKAAYEQRNYPAAAEQFRSFLKTAANSSEAPVAQYYLGLALLEAAQPDYHAAGEALAAAANVEGFAQRGHALYYLGLSLRSQAHQAAMQAIQAGADEAKAAPLREASAKFYAQAAERFARSAEALAGAGDWPERARCAAAEALLKVGKHKEAAAAVAPALSAASPGGAYARLAAYYAGEALLGANDPAGAMRALSTLPPFEDPVTALGARFMLAQVHEQSGEYPEAAALYEAALAEYPKSKQAVSAMLQNPPQPHGRLDERVRVETFAAAALEYAPRINFHLGGVYQAMGRHGEAVARLGEFIQQNPKSPLLPEAMFALAASRLEMKQFAEAAKTFAVLAEHPALGGRATWMLGRAQAGAGDPANLGKAVETLRKAAENLEKSAADPAAKRRHLEVLADLGDAQQAARRHKEAASTYQKALDAAAESAEQAESVLPKLATALHSAGLHAEADASCQRFIAAFPRSPQMPAVLFRHAENALARGNALAGDAAKAAPFFEEAAKRYLPLIETYPEFAHVSHARLGLASACIALGRHAKAAEALAAIPAAERLGTLAHVPYLLAECLMRTLPEDSDDALAAARLIEQSNTAAALLAEFVSAQPQHPQAPDAWLKLGQCRLRVASAVADPQEKLRLARSAQDALAKVIHQHSGHAAYPEAVYESARASLAMNDANSAAQQLSRFQSAPLKNTAIAPTALIQLGECLRKLNRAAEAVNLLGQLRAEQEPLAAGDPARKAVMARVMLMYGLALKDVSKHAEARAIFETLAAQHGERPEAVEAKWRTAQSKKEEAAAGLASAVQKLAGVAGGNPEQIKPAQDAVDAAARSLAEAAASLSSQGQALSESRPGIALAAMLDAASAYQLVRDTELAAAREKLSRETLAKLEARRKAETPQIAGLPALRPFQPPITAAAPPASEQKAREALKAVIDAAGDTPAGIEAALRLADLHTQRNEYDPAIAVLRAALEHDMPQAAAERVNVELGYALLGKGDAASAAAAMPLFEQVTQNVNGPLYARARLGYAECSLVQKDYSTAVQRLARFRDKPELANRPGVTDRALTLLGHAYAALNQWEPSRAAFRTMLDRSGGSPYRSEAYFGMATALRQLNQLDEAAATYAHVVSRTSDEWAAKAQLAIGQCKVQQKKWDEAMAALLIVYYTYDYPELSASALYEAAHAMVQLKKPQEAKGLLDRLVKENPGGQWAELARKRLAEIK